MKNIYLDELAAEFHRFSVRCQWRSMLFGNNTVVLFYKALRRIIPNLAGLDQRGFRCLKRSVQSQTEVMTIERAG